MNRILSPDCVCVYLFCLVYVFVYLIFYHCTKKQDFNLNYFQNFIIFKCQISQKLLNLQRKLQKSKYTYKLFFLILLIFNEQKK